MTCQDILAIVPKNMVVPCQVSAHLSAELALWEWTMSEDKTPKQHLEILVRDGVRVPSGSFGKEASRGPLRAVQLRSRFITRIPSPCLR